MAEPRLEHAERLLREAVFRSRARQAAGVSLRGGGDLRAEVGPGRCGLGKEAAVELDLGEEGAEAFEALFPDGLEPAALRRVREVLDAWVREADALDRRRNHFLRDFRGAHGSDRRAYSPEEARAYEEGLERVNADVRERLSRTASRLLESARA